MSSERVEEFYEQNPFPYFDPEDIDSRDDLYRMIGEFEKALDRAIPQDSKILVAGCGTGILANFLAISGRDVFAIDLSQESIDTARSVKKNLEIEEVEFKQKNITDLDTSQSYDLVISLGVLHHLSKPQEGFRVISECLKDGYIVLGLYNKYGRIRTKARKVLFRLTGNRFKRMDPYLRKQSLDAKRSEIFFNDQYRHPNEFSFSIGDIISWFEEQQIDFRRCIPSQKRFKGQKQDLNLFKTTRKPSLLAKIKLQTRWFLNEAEGNGYFIMIGQKE
ncbi:MAG: methyltransferase domain-containing protein [Nanohaloarchaea archaeon]|nr:methyltransferase domain-containing protein [Candidatus Nanohaloarchaea archaeon]